MNFTKNKFLIYIIYLLFGTYLIIYSFGVIYQSDFASQIAMSKFISEEKILYDDNSFDRITSEYFPGLAIIFSIFVKFINPKILFEFIQLLSILLLILFFYTQKKITEKIYPNLKSENFYLALICFILFITPNWIRSVLTYKTDILAFMLAYYAINLAKLFEKNTYDFKFLLSAILFGLCIALKQQFVALLFALLIYTVFNFNKKNIIFTIITFFISGLVLYLILNNKSGYLFTFKYFELTEKFSFIAWMLIQKILIKKIFFSIILIMILFKYSNLFGIKIDKIFKVLKETCRKKKIELLFIIFFSAASFLSSTIVGGNIVNVEQSLIFLFPIFYLIFQNIKKNIFKILCLVLIFYSFVTKSPDHLKEIKYSYQFKNYILKNFPNNKKYKILTHGSLYPAMNFLKGSEKYTDIHTKKILEKINTKETLLLSDFNMIKIILQKNDFDFLILHSQNDIIDFLKENYKVTFYNSSFMVLEKKN